jgi:hypothetical protein
MQEMFRRSLVVAVAASFVVAAPAGAATFTSTADGLRFTAAPGVANQVTVFGDPDPATLVINTPNDPVTYSDAAPLPAGCADADQNDNEPPASAIQCDGVTVKLTFDLGDLADGFDTTGTLSNLTILGGPGNDDLGGGNGTQAIDGGAGNDAMSGGAGDDELRGGDDGDTLAGGPDTDRLFGDAGSDSLDGGGGNDALDGGSGDDRFDDEPGDDVAIGGSGDDEFDLGAGTDTVRGGDGTDAVYPHDDGDADDFDGGAGHDQFVVFAPGALTVDLAAGTATNASATDVATGFEDLLVDVGAATLSGTGGSNLIFTLRGDATVDPRAGNDVVQTSGDDDTIETRDGFADRVSCGEGVDTVRADTLDDVANDCENVTRTDVGNANDAPGAPEDRAPTVTIGAPSSAALLSTVTPNTITATASDDVGVARVVFSTGERTLCTDTAAPYTCDYSPTSADVGRDTLVAIAVDTAGQTASAVRVVNVPRFKATSLTAATSPKRDGKAPYTFTTKGKLALPSGVAPAAGCKGTVDVSFKAGTKTVSSRRVTLKPDCTYSSKVTFKLPRRLNPKILSVVVVHGGNEVVEGVQAKRHSVRPR